MEYIFSVKIWLIIGFALSILEVFSGLFFALSFGIAGFAMAGLLKVWPNLLTEWYEIIFVYCIFGLLVSTLAWSKLRKTEALKKDIND